MTPLPKPPTGSSHLAQIIRQLIKCVDERTVLNSSFLQINRTDRGVFLRAKDTKGKVKKLLPIREQEVCIDGEEDWFIKIHAGQPYQKDAEGNPVDGDGNPVDEDGNPIEPEGD